MESEIAMTSSPAKERKPNKARTEGLLEIASGSIPVPRPLEEICHKISKSGILKADMRERWSCIENAGDSVNKFISLHDSRE